MTRLHFKHQTECDLLEDMRYEHVSASHACADKILFSSVAKVQRNTFSNCQIMFNLVKACLRRAHGRSHAQNEIRKQLLNEGGAAWRRKRDGAELSYCSFWEGQNIGKMKKEFPAVISLSISPFFTLAHPCLLMTCVSLAAFLYIFGNGRKPWFLSFSVLTKHWFLMTANSLMFSASLLPSKSFSLFLIFTVSLPLVSLRLLQLQLFVHRLPTCCWVLESGQSPGLTCGEKGTT